MGTQVSWKSVTQFLGLEMWRSGQVAGSGCPESVGGGQWAGTLATFAEQGLQSHLVTVGFAGGMRAQQRPSGYRWLCVGCRGLPDRLWTPA